MTDPLMRRFTGNRGGEKGFTIIETMIAMTVVAIALMGFAPLVIRSNDVNQMVGENHIARIGARMMLDEIRSTDFSAIESKYSNYSFDVDIDGDGKPDLQPPKGVARVGSVKIDKVPGIELKKLALQVSVILKWRGRSGDRQYRLSTVRSLDWGDH